MTLSTRPTLSVVIPLYNKRDTITRAINSVLSQRDVGVELVVVDDGSTDGSAEVVRGLDDERIKLVQQTNQGPGSARNSGAALTSFPFLSFLDADDEWLPDFAAAGLRALAENDECVAYVCAYDAGAFRNRRPNAVRELGLQARPYPLPTELDGRTIKQHTDAMHSSCVVVRRAVFEEIGGYYVGERCIYGEDSYLWLQVLFAGPVHWDPAERTRFHVEDSGLGYSSRRWRKPRPLSVEFEALSAKCPETYAGSLRRAAKTFANHDLKLMRWSGEVRQARRLRQLHNCDNANETILDLVGYGKFVIKTSVRDPLRRLLHARPTSDVAN